MSVKLDKRLPQLRVTSGLARAVKKKARMQHMRLSDAMRAALVDWVSEPVYPPTIPQEREGVNGK
jgi:hypothetical protein